MEEQESARVRALNESMNSQRMGLENSPNKNGGIKQIRFADSTKSSGMTATFMKKNTLSPE